MKNKGIIYNFHGAIVAIIFAMLGTLSSCISNDIPYPVVELAITNVQGVGFTMQSVDYGNQAVTIKLDETTDISNVEITDVTYTPDATLSQSLIGTFNMQQPLEVTLSLYQSYEWKIIAEQTIERNFTVQGQVGQAEIDVDNLTATAYVSESVDLENITILELKLGPEGITTISPSIDQITYFETFRTVTISYYSVVETWRLYVKTTDVLVSLTQCNLWANKAILTAAGDSSGSCGFYYRMEGTTVWIEVAEANIEKNEGQFSTTVTGLNPNTAYEFKAYSEDNESEIIVGTTEQEVALTNGGFEEWSKPATPWLPYLDVETRYWDTGNTGSAIASINITTPCEDDLRPGTDGIYSAELSSKKVLVKFAAGNIFTGKYVKTVVTNGIIGFGQPFEQRPTALRGWVKYNCGVIDMVGTTSPPGETIISGETSDTGIIYAALGTWTPEEYGYSSDGEMLGDDQTPIIIDTRDVSTFFNPYSSAVISYGELLLTESHEEWLEFTIPLIYNDIETIPTHIVIVASSSRYGDYFTGSTSSTMWIDDFELVYE
ncbi:MAG: PCMD domain-containing protein [Rikenellaceae bacterium]